MASTKSKSSEERLDPYQCITEQMIRLLQKTDIGQWRQTWKTSGGLLPRNMDTNNVYHGANPWVLGLAAMEMGYTSPHWGTYRQISELGGHVVKGEHGTYIRKWTEVVDKLAPPEPNGEPKRRGFIKFYKVFNYHQTEGLDPERFAIRTPEPQSMDERCARAVEAANAYMLNGGPSLRHGLDKAYYSQTLDMISVPEIGAFETPGDYIATLFHEITHSTGHKNRLARPGIEGGHQFGSEPYAVEELAAQMGSTFATCIFDIDPEANMERSAAYMNSWRDPARGEKFRYEPTGDNDYWISQLQADKTLILEAARSAQKAIEHAGLSFEQEIVMEHDQVLTPEIEHIEVVGPQSVQSQETSSDPEMNANVPVKSLAALRKELVARENELSVSSTRRDNPEALARCDLDIERYRLGWQRLAVGTTNELQSDIARNERDYQIMRGSIYDPIRRQELIAESQTRHAGDEERTAEAYGAMEARRGELRQVLGNTAGPWIQQLGHVTDEDTLLEVTEYRVDYTIDDPERPFGDLGVEDPDQARRRAQLESRIEATHVEVGLYQSR